MKARGGIRVRAQWGLRGGNVGSTGEAVLTERGPWTKARSWGKSTKPSGGLE